MTNKLKVSRDKPPIWDRLVDKFNVVWERDGIALVVAYDDTIYCSSEPTPDVIEHELVHLIQQKIEGAKEWWDKYLEDQKFRLEQEIPAYRRQYEVLKIAIRDRNLLARELARLARDLSSRQYGGIIGYSEALKSIRNGRD